MKILSSFLTTASVLLLSAMTASAANTTVHVSDFQFSPANVTINLGDTVHWVWDSGTHSTTANGGQMEDWDSGHLSASDTFDHTFTNAGTFAYHCSIHAFMHGNVTVIDPNPAVNLTALSLLPTSVTGGNTVDGTVTLGANATMGGANVTLSSDNMVFAVPSVANVTVEEGSKTANFTVITEPVDTATTANISASFNGTTKTVKLTLLPAHPLSGLALTPDTVPGGSTSKGTVTLASASMSDTVVTLSSDNAAAVVPANVTIVANTTTANFTITTTAVTSEKMPIITATAGGVVKTEMLMVEPVAVASLKLSPATVKSAKKSTGTVTLQIAAPANIIVTLTSANTAIATVGTKTITISKGKKTGTFTVTAKKVTTKKTVLIKAQAKGSSTLVSAKLTVTK
jgi:plastocyanin